LYNINIDFCSVNVLIMKTNVIIKSFAPNRNRLPDKYFDTPSNIFKVRGNYSLTSFLIVNDLPVISLTM